MLADKNVGKAKRTARAKIRRHDTTWCGRSHSSEIILEGRRQG